ncbi:MAG: hypothetical protein LKF79_04625 [Solobacterium sp.]|jgi:hypothetical protein|nr:hypothetical protein [Solobacterium sp.]
MKVKYIGDYYDEAIFIKEKEYEVLEEQNGWYRIVDETDDDYLFPSEDFEIVSK